MILAYCLAIIIVSVAVLVIGRVLRRKERTAAEAAARNRNAEIWKRTPLAGSARRGVRWLGGDRRLDRLNAILHARQRVGHALVSGEGRERGRGLRITAASEGSRTG